MSQVSCHKVVDGHFGARGAEGTAMKLADDGRQFVGTRVGIGGAVRNVARPGERGTALHARGAATSFIPIR